MLARALLLVALSLSVALGGTTPRANAAPVGLPAAPSLTREGYQLILDYEVGGGRRYYDAYLKRPTWPGAASGVTIGVGYDCGYNSARVIRSDWEALRKDWIERLAAAAGVTGDSAKLRAQALRDILIEWEDAEVVFNDVTLARFTDLTRRTFPGFDALAPNAQAALVSLVFNRGSSMSGPSRAEMRTIRDLVPKRDYAGIAAAIRSMKRLWAGKGLDGLLKRREAEARLVETCK